MSQEKTFISESLLRTEVPKTPKEYLNQELQEDISVFSEEEKGLILRKIGGENLQGKEKSTYVLAINRWWKEKYGFPFEKKAAREEVLFRKYAPAKKTKERQDLQIELLRAVEEGEDDKIAQIKERYITAYPDQLEGIEALFGIRDFIKKQNDFNENGKKLAKEKRMEIFRDFTEYQFLFTHFILLNSHDREFMNLFWRAGFAIAERMGEVSKFNVLRRAQVSQVAVHKIIDSLEKNPKLSHPDDDAFNAIDLWTEGGEAIQIKGWEEEIPAVIESDVVAFPAIETNDTKKIKLFNSIEYLKSKNIIFRAKIKDYGQKLGRDIAGHILVVPYSKIDFITGDPAPELIEFFKKEIK